LLNTLSAAFANMPRLASHLLSVRGRAHDVPREALTLAPRWRLKAMQRTDSPRALLPGASAPLGPDPTTPGFWNVRWPKDTDHVHTYSVGSSGRRSPDPEHKKK